MRNRALALLEGADHRPEETPLFTAEERRLVILPAKAGLTVSRGHEEGYQRYAIALAGLALLGKGAELSPDWQQPILQTEACAAAGNAAREAALSALLGQ